MILVAIIQNAKNLAVGVVPFKKGADNSKVKFIDKVKKDSPSPASALNYLVCVMVFPHFLFHVFMLCVCYEC